MDEEKDMQKQEPEVITQKDLNDYPTNDRKGFNVTSLILGIISTISFCWWYVSIPAGIIAIIFSIAGKKDAGRGMGVAGMVLGIIGIVLCVLIYMLAILGIAAITTGVYGNTIY